jgi:hypothetical protein
MEQTNVKTYTATPTVENTVTESSTSDDGEKKISSSTVSNVDLNKKAMRIMNENGSEEAVRYMFDPTGKRQLTYAEMRSMFG